MLLIWRSQLNVLEFVNIMTVMQLCIIYCVYLKYPTYFSSFVFLPDRKTHYSETCCKILFVFSCVSMRKMKKQKMKYLWREFVFGNHVRFPIYHAYKTQPRNKMKPGFVILWAECTTYYSSLILDRTVSICRLLLYFLCFQWKSVLKYISL